MKDWLTWLSRRRFPYEPLIKIEISAANLIHNLAEFKRLAPGGRIAPVLKSNAYGHGLFEVAHILKREDIPFFVVDSYFEAVALRGNGFKPPILVIGYTRPETVNNSRLKNVAYTISSLEGLRSVISASVKIHFHVKVDTGMHRQGLLPEEVDEAIRILREDPYTSPEGICSHFADADNTNNFSSSESQINIWNQVTKKFKAAFPHIRYFHLSNTDGHRFTADTDVSCSRLGIGLYGVGVNGQNTREMGLDLKPALKLTTLITGVKKIRKDEAVGYGNTFKAPRDMTIATIPVGYYEALDRRLSNKGFVKIWTDHPGSPNQTGTAEFAPIVGRVSMNITTIDVSAVPRVKIGDPVVVISDLPSDRNSIANLAALCETIDYELLVHIAEHLKREIV